MAKAPCYNDETKTDCPRREAGCHSHCEKWKEYEALRNEEYRQRRIRCDAVGAAIDSRERAIGKKYNKSLRWHRCNKRGRHY